MSYSTWSTNGYGVCVENLDFTLERLEELISRAPEFESELKKYFNDEEIATPSIYDYLEYDDDYSGGIAYILKRVIQEAENIELCYADDFNCNWYLLLEASYPWYNTSQEEQNLTEKTIKEIIKKYISILTDKEVEFDYQCVQNGG